MLQLSRPARQPGFTIVELMVGLAILGILLAVGIPNMTHWVLASKARAASEFYAEGLTMARRQAVTHNARTRFVLTPNANGQMDWQVDLCFPTPDAPCDADSDGWSTPDAVADGDPDGNAAFKSVFRPADALPPASVLVPSLAPAGSSTVYFTELGWVDTGANNRLSRIRLDPATDFAGDVPVVALAISLAGMTAKCDPTRNAPDTRACPP